MAIQQMLLGAKSAGASPTGTYGTYSFYRSFPGGSSPSLSTAQAFSTWLNNFENSNNVTQMTMTFSQGTTYTITDVNYINGLRAAVASGSDYGTGSTNNWFLGWNCQSGTSLSYLFSRNGNHSPTFVIGGTSSCSCSYTQIRPLINNANWGGWNGGCGKSTQSMGMSFTGYV